MRRGLGFFAVVSLVPLLAHCGSSGSSAPNGNASTGGTSSGDFALAVSNAAYATDIDGVAARPGDVFLIVSLTLRNGSVTTPLGGDPIDFSVTLASHLVVTVAPASAKVPTACRPDVSAAVGGTLECAVAFEIPNGDEPQSLGYDDHRGNSASATIPAPAAEGSPIVGTWTNSTDMAQEVFTFGADGIATYSLSAQPTCTGTLDWDGLTWSATERTLSLGGSPKCSGSLKCGSSGIGCSAGTAPPGGDCDYALGNGNATMTLTCGAKQVQLTRK